MRKLEVLPIFQPLLVNGQENWGQHPQMSKSLDSPFVVPGPCSLILDIVLLLKNMLSFLIHNCRKYDNFVCSK